MLTVKDLLNRKDLGIISIDPDSNVYQALQLMANRNIGALLVMNNDELLGIFSERDYARNITLKGRSERKTSVKDVMATQLISVNLEHGVNDCLEIMTKRHVRHLPVFSDADLIGIISIGDVVKGAIDERENTISHLERYIAGA